MIKEQPLLETYFGLVSWYDPAKGFGVIREVGGEEVFLHSTQLTSDVSPSSLAVGVALRFKKILQRGKISAVQCGYANDLESLKYALNRFNLANEVRVEINSGRSGRSISLVDSIKVIFKSVIKNVPEAEVCKAVTDYYTIYISQGSTEVYKAFYNFSEKYLKLDLLPKELQPFLTQIAAEQLNKLSAEELINACIEKNYGAVGLSPVFEERQRQLQDRNDELLAILMNTVESKASALGSIKTVEELRPYQNFINLCLKELSIGHQQRFLDFSQTTLINNLDSSMSVKAWEQGISVNPTPVEIGAGTLNYESYHKAQLLSRLPHNSSIELVEYWSLNNALAVPEAILQYLAKIDNITPNELKQKICFDQGQDEKYVLFYKWMNIFKLSASPQQINEAFLTGWLPNYNENEALTKWLIYSDEQRSKLWNSKDISYKFRREVLYKEVPSLTTQTSYTNIFRKAKQLLTQEDWQSFELHVFYKLQPSTALHCWVNDYISIYPEAAVAELFANLPMDKKILHSLNSLRKLSKIKISEIYGAWLKDIGQASKTDKSSLIEETLTQLVAATTISTVEEFYKLGFQLIVLNEINIDWRKNAQVLLQTSSNQMFEHSISWYLSYSDELEFDIIKSVFVFYTTEDQLFFLRKLFDSHVKGKIVLTPERLSELTRLDVNIYQINESYESNQTLDISAGLCCMATVR